MVLAGYNAMCREGDVLKKVVGEQHVADVSTKPVVGKADVETSRHEHS